MKPIHLLIGGSGIIFIITLIISFIINFQIINFPLWVIIGLPIVTALISYAVFYFFIKYFINDRLKILYRSIRKDKFTPENTIKFKLTDDVIADAEIETQRWTEERNKEIVKLKEQEEFRREFLGNLAHELKTPVFSIQGYILTLLDGGLEDETVNRSFLERASKATDRMANILDDLDQITKLEVNAFKIEMRSFDIKELIVEVLESLELIASEKNITLKLHKDYNSKFVLGDRSKIAQVLINLISNSIFYGNENGNTIIRLFSMDNIITIEVSDDGPGIEQQHIPRLFERFYRVEKSRNRNEGGSGLGLAIVKHIIESHGQSISVRSTIGIGSTFSFSLDKSKSQTPSLYSSRGIQIK
ncbi:MAG: sensor histidine kinase [Crocinitomicaceae bacterium]|nr:sensor histidine kinase [Crocinitomicaceae bacterium]